MCFTFTWHSSDVYNSLACAKHILLAIWTIGLGLRSLDKVFKMRSRKSIQMSCVVIWNFLPGPFLGSGTWESTLWKSPWFASLPLPNLSGDSSVRDFFPSFFPSPNVCSWSNLSRFYIACLSLFLSNIVKGIRNLRDLLRTVATKTTQSFRMVSGNDQKASWLLFGKKWE